MQKYKIILNFLLLLFPLLLLAKPKHLNEEWLQIDKSSFINLMKTLDSNVSNIEYYKQNIPSLSILSSRVMGFDIKKIVAHQEGKYISKVFSIYTYKDIIFNFKITISGVSFEKMNILKEKDKNIKKLLSNSWVETSTQPYFPLDSMILRQFEYEVLNENIYSNLKKNVANHLGNFINIYVEDSIKKEYETLIFPFEDYNFGTACGYAGTVPKGRRAIKVIKKKNPELLKNILRAYSPEGRVYGAEALMELSNKGMIHLSTEDISSIKKVLSLDVSINQCGGCMSSYITAKQIFQSKKDEEFKYINQFLK